MAKIQFLYIGYRDQMFKISNIHTKAKISYRKDSLFSFENNSIFLSFLNSRAYELGSFLKKSQDTG